MNTDTNGAMGKVLLTWKVDAFAFFVAYSLGEMFEEVGACCVQLGKCMSCFCYHNEFASDLVEP